MQVFRSSKRLAYAAFGRLIAAHSAANGASGKTAGALCGEALLHHIPEALAPSSLPQRQILRLSTFGPGPVCLQSLRDFSALPKARSPPGSRPTKRRTKSQERSHINRAVLRSEQEAGRQQHVKGLSTERERPPKTQAKPNAQHTKDFASSSKRQRAAAVEGASRKQQDAKEKQPEQQTVTYKGLKAAVDQRRKSGSSEVPEEQIKHTLSALRKFQESSLMKDRALAIYVSAKAFPRLAELFGQFVVSAASMDLEESLGSLPRAQRQLLLFRLFAEYAVDCHSKELQAYRHHVTSMDLRKPYLWYPVARALKRKFIYHAGPTNSGKTYTALQAMRNAPTGLYCGPLRLLAMEVYDELNASGTFCNLITGQERRILPSAAHTSCTIEMLHTSKRVDVAIIDEIQLLGDEGRGWAWTRALQGCPANEIHLCGDGSAIPLVKTLASAMGEPVEIKTYRRFSPVQVDEAGLVNGFKDIQPGDCVVAFSRKAIYEVKSLIESITGLRTCVVYGALPPETRRQQARLFNEEGNEFSVMVASDAVGMGLNLNIRRIIFTTLTKFQGVSQKSLTVSEIKQIAGRAGRRNSQFPLGYVTCLDPADVPTLQQALDVPLRDLRTPAAGLFPEFEHLEAYAGRRLNMDFMDILKQFAQEARLDGTYFFCRQEGMEEAAKLLAKVEGLSLQEKFCFCMAPANMREPRQAAALLHFATRFAARQPVTLDLLPVKATPKTPDELHHMEQLHQIMSCWLWLSNRFEVGSFPGRAEVEEMSETLIEKMHTSLQHMYNQELEQSTSARKPQNLQRFVEALKQPFLKNLSWDAKQHLTGATQERINKLMMQRLSSMPKKERHRKAWRLTGKLIQGKTTEHLPELAEAVA